MPTEKVSGSVATLIAGILELLENTVYFGLYVANLVHSSDHLLHSTKFSVKMAIFGIYILLTYFASSLLVYAALARASIYIRKCICVGWITFRIFCFTLTLILIVAGEWWRDKTHLTICCVSMVMWAIFVTIVAFYLSKLAKALHEKRSANKRKAMKRFAKNLVSQQTNVVEDIPREPWSKSPFQVIRKEHVFSTMRKF